MMAKSQAMLNPIVGESCMATTPQTSMPLTIITTRKTAISTRQITSQATRPATGIFLTK